MNPTDRYRLWERRFWTVWGVVAAAVALVFATGCGKFIDGKVDEALKRKIRCEVTIVGGDPLSPPPLEVELANCRRLEQRGPKEPWRDMGPFDLVNAVPEGTRVEFEFSEAVVAALRRPVGPVSTRRAP